MTADLPIRTNPVQEIKTADGKVFDIGATYQRILSEDPDIAMPVAAIEALIELLALTTSSTVMETIEIVKDQSEKLKNSVSNPIPLRAGTDMFAQYLTRSLRQPTDSARNGGTGSAHESFDETRQHLVRNSRLFIARAKDARNVTALNGAKYVMAGSTVLTTGGSRLVKMSLCRAAERRKELNGHVDFKVIYVMDGSKDSEPAVQALRTAGIKVATVDPAACAHAIDFAKVDTVFLGAEAVCQNGSVLSRIGTYQLAKLAKNLGINILCLSETHKFVRVSPLDQSLARHGVKQSVLDFRCSDEIEGNTAKPQVSQNQIDMTPPEYITSIITEQGSISSTKVYDILLDSF